MSTFQILLLALYIGCVGYAVLCLINLIKNGKL